MRSALVAVGVLALLPSASSAAVIFDQQVNLTLGARASDIDFPNQVADDFQLQPGASTVSDIHWWGVYGNANTPPASDNFTIRIFADVAGTPAINPLHQFNVGNASRTDTGTDLAVLGWDVYFYSVDIASLALAANTTYWLSIVNDTTADGDDDWYWSMNPSLGNANQRGQDGGGWTLSPDEMGFQLTDDAVAVAEPWSLALLGFGLAGLGLTRRKRAA